MLGEKSVAGAPLSRRDMIRALLGAGSGSVLSRTVLAHPIGKYLTDGTLLASADSQVAHEQWKPLCLNPQQNATLIVLAEDILPNSNKARVNRFIDLLLSVDVDEVRQQFNNSLAAFDQESMHRFGHPFKEVSNSDRQVILASSSNQGSHGTGEPVQFGGRPPSANNSANQNTPHDHFQNLKTWIVGAYYSSEFGMRELGWTGMVSYENFPGCQHPGGHA